VCTALSFAIETRVYTCVLVRPWPPTFGTEAQASTSDTSAAAAARAGRAGDGRSDPHRWKKYHASPAFTAPVARHVARVGGGLAGSLAGVPPLPSLPASHASECLAPSPAGRGRAPAPGPDERQRIPFADLIRALIKPPAGLL